MFRILSEVQVKFFFFWKVLKEKKNCKAHSLAVPLHRKQTIIQESRCLFGRRTTEHGDGEDLRTTEEDWKRIDGSAGRFFVRFIEAANEILSRSLDGWMIPMYVKFIGYCQSPTEACGSSSRRVGLTFYWQKD